MRKFLLYLYTILLGISIACFSIEDIFAEEKKTITIFNSGYLENFYTNRQIANFGIELLGNSVLCLEN